jgi:hypothetical protein
MLDPTAPVHLLIRACVLLPLLMVCNGALLDRQSHQLKKSSTFRQSLVLVQLVPGRVHSNCLVIAT